MRGVNRVEYSFTWRSSRNNSRRIPSLWRSPSSTGGSALTAFGKKGESGTCKGGAGGEVKK
eukprot:759394-Hanusia_phi.AAC.7